MDEKLARDRSGTLDYDGALDEVVADGCEMMLKRSSVVETMARENRGLFDRIHDWLQRWASRIKEAFAGVEAYHEEAKAMLDYMDQLQRIWDKALERAAQNANESRVRENEAGVRENETAATEDGRVQYSIERTQDNRPYVYITDDILQGVLQNDWGRTVHDTLRQRFPNGVTLGRNQILIDRTSRNELTHSRSTVRLYNTDQQTYADKFRALYNADELLQVTTGWINEQASHARRDNIVDFARGHALIRVGKNDYEADVVVGTRRNGNMLLYDVVHMRATQFSERETDTSYDVNSNKRTIRSDVSASDSSILSSSEKSNNKIQDMQFVLPFLLLDFYPRMCV